ncbi:MAG: hypothetical protein LAN64_01810 [Acidobacteriia bacterium]|nr:hypothetical protein [Terriglobia bacterium]
MATTVGAIQIDLVAGLAKFKEGMREGTDVATRETRAMSQAMRSETQEARGSLMLLGEEVGVRMPRHLQAFVVQLPGVAKVMSAAFSSIAVLALIEVIVKGIEKITEWQKKAQELADAWKKIDTEGQAALRSVGEEILDAQKKIDELTGNHLGAMMKALQQIDNQTLDHLRTEFDKLSQGVLTNLLKMQTAWLQVFAAGSAPDVAKQLEKFRDEYNKLLMLGKGDEASALLHKTLISATQGYGRMAQNPMSKQDIAAQALSGDVAGAAAQYATTYTKEAVEAQQKFVELLQLQVQLETKSNELAKDKKTIVKTGEAQRGENDKDAALKASREIGDAKITLIQDQQKLQQATIRTGQDEVRNLTLADVAEQVKTAKDAADAKYREDVDYWNQIIANHTLNTEEDKKIRANANTQIELLGIKHQDALVKADIEGANKRLEVIKQEMAARLQAQQQAIRESEKIAQDKLALAQEDIKNAEAHVKVLYDLHKIDSKQELDMLLDLHKKEYDAELDRLNTKVQNAAAELVIEANKNGQILTMDEALVKARKNLDSEYLKAKAKLEGDNQKTIDDNSKKLQQSYEKITGQFSDQLNQMLVTGKANWTSFFQSIETDMLKLIEKRLFQQLFNGLTGGEGSGGGGFLSFLGGLFGMGGGTGSAAAGSGATGSVGSGLGDWGGLADGGSALPGSTYMVGEEGPEVLKMGASGGTVFPNRALAPIDSNNKTFSPTLIFQVNGVSDADSFRKSETQIMADAQRHMMAAYRRNG